MDGALKWPLYRRECGEKTAVNGILPGQRLLKSLKSGLSGNRANLLDTFSVYGWLRMENMPFWKQLLGLTLIPVISAMIAAASAIGVLQADQQHLEATLLKQEVQLKEFRGDVASRLRNIERDVYLIQHRNSR